MGHVMNIDLNQAQHCALNKALASGEQERSWVSHEYRSALFVGF